MTIFPYFNAAEKLLFMKKKFLSTAFTGFILSFFLACSSVQVSGKKTVSIFPPEDYGQLFYDVQTDEDIFPDSKTFVDAVPLHNVDRIKKSYADLEDKSTASVSDFLQKNFRIPKQETTYKTDSSSINEHIQKLWQVLKRPADEKEAGTLISLPHPYIVPGGRFREIYYWDSYFTMLGLKEDGEIETIENMVDNFAFLIREFGFIPNGNRTYYLSRSQPPFFALMVELLAEEKGERIYRDYIDVLEREYDFWMQGSDILTPSNVEYQRVVLLPQGEILNRYWDDKNTPRPESYREDVETAKEAINEIPELEKEAVYRNLRAAAESGWDFSSRWLSRDEQGKYRLSTIHTTKILPVDLNSLLYNLEKTLAKANRLSGFIDKAENFDQKAKDRKEAIQKYFWDEEKNYYMDYNFEKHSKTAIISAAGMFPLFFKISRKEQAQEIAETIEESLLRPGGVVTTSNNTGQQWDAPNGWAPLQWMSILGLRNYDQHDLADEIKTRWLELNSDVYYRTYKLLEKYNVEDITKESGGGEYPTQDGFGWTNGVFQKLSKEN